MEYSFSYIGHENVVQCYGIYVEPGEGVGLVLELMEGDLESVLKKRSLATENKINIILDIALGLESLHSLNHVHRDLYPRNIMLWCNCSRAKISDFGRAWNFYFILATNRTHDPPRFNQNLGSILENYYYDDLQCFEDLWKELLKDTEGCENLIKLAEEAEKKRSSIYDICNQLRSLYPNRIQDCVQHSKAREFFRNLRNHPNQANFISSQWSTICSNNNNNNPPSLLCDEFGFTVVHYLCRSGSLDALQEVLKLLPQDMILPVINNRNNIQLASPLLIACQFFKANIVEYLMTMGADVNLGSHGNITPLHICAVQTSTSIFNLIKKCKKLVAYPLMEFPQLSKILGHRCRISPLGLALGCDLPNEDFQEIYAKLLVNQKNYPDIVLCILEELNFVVPFAFDLNSIMEPDSNTKKQLDRLLELLKLSPNELSCNNAR